MTIHCFLLLSFALTSIINGGEFKGEVNQPNEPISSEPTSSEPTNKTHMPMVTEHVAVLRGVYQEIDIRRETEAIQGLNSTEEQTREEWAARVQEESDRFAPAVFFHLAAYLFEQGEEQDALFWLYAGRMRTHFDIERCTDKSVVGAVDMLSQKVPQLLRLSQFEDVDNAKEVMQQAFEWDDATEHNYDPRWIALHGIGAFTPVPAPGTEEPLTVPEDMWDELAEKVRTEYSEHYFDAFSELSDDQRELIDAKIAELRQEQESNPTENDN